MNCCALVSLKLDNSIRLGWTDLASCSLEMFVVVQGRFKR